MPLEIGDARKGTGLAGRIAELIAAEDPAYNVNRSKAWVMPNAVATAVVEQLTTNALVETPFPDPPPAPGVDILPGTIT